MKPFLTIENNRPVLITAAMFGAEMEKLKANGAITMRPDANHKTPATKQREQQAMCMARLRAERKGKTDCTFPKRVRCHKHVHRKRITSLIFTALAIRQTAAGLLNAVEIALAGLK